MMLQPCACVSFFLCFKFVVCSVSRGFSYVLERVCWCLTLYVLLHVALVHFVYIHKNKRSKDMNRCERMNVY